MRQLSEQTRLILKHAKRVLVLCIVRIQALDNDVTEEAALPPLASKKDFRHAAGSNLVQQLVPPDLPVPHSGSILERVRGNKDVSQRVRRLAQRASEKVDD